MLHVMDTYRQILLVGEDQEERIPQFVLVQHPLQLVACLLDTVAVIAVDDEDDALSVLEVMSPQWANLVLSTDIPHCELDVLVLDSLDVEACERRLSMLLRSSQSTIVIGFIEVTYRLWGLL